MEREKGRFSLPSRTKVILIRSLPTEQFSSNGRVANRHSLIRTLMNDGTFVSLVQRGTGLTDIRSRM